MNIGQCKTKAIKLINNYSASGNIIPMTDSSQIDYVLKMNDLIDAVQKDIATTAKKISAPTKISQYPCVNILANPLYMFDVVEHTTSDLTYSTNGAKAYYFEVDNLADIYIEEQINGIYVPLPTPIHIQVTAKPNGFSAYKGFITPNDPNNNVQIRFSGNYEYRIRYIAMYASNFATLSDIPPYTRYTLYPMPSDFFELKPDGITFKGNQSDGYPYQKTNDYYWEYDENGKDVIAINYYNKGEYSIFYNRYPKTIDDTTLDTQELENTPEVQELYPYYVGAYAIMAEDSSIGTQLLNVYYAKKSELTGGQIYGADTITNTSGW